MNTPLNLARLESAPAWSTSIDAGVTVDYAPALPIADALIALAPADRRRVIAQYHAAHCFPKLDLPRASALYLLLRMVFDLPLALPRDRAKVFGGWLHPSVGNAPAPFDLAWPLRIDPDDRSVRVERFTGYAGKGYDALGEYDYFAANFPLRRPDAWRNARIRG